MAVVMWPDGAHALDAPAAVVCAGTAAAWCWASLYQRRHVRSGGLFGNAGLQMAFSGVLGIALTLGTTGFTHGHGLGRQGAIALVYLVVGGSCIAFASYQYLVRVWHPARAGSFAYINPVIAVLLGWLLAAEPLHPRLLVGMAIILAAVAVLQYATRPRIRADDALTAPAE